MNSPCNTKYSAIGFATYGEYILSRWWKDKCAHVISTRGATCEKCKKPMYEKHIIFYKYKGKFYPKEITKYNRLNVHHIRYDNLGNEPSADLLVLCEECHAKEHCVEVGL